MVLSVRVDGSLRSMRTQLVRTSTPFRRAVLRNNAFLRVQGRDEADLVVCLRVIRGDAALSGVRYGINFLARLMIPILIVEDRARCSIMTFSLHTRPREARHARRGACGCWPVGLLRFILVIFVICGY